MEEKTEIAVVGGGFAGLSAALYAARAGAAVTVLERGAPGGQILTAGRVENYPGSGDGDGAALAERLLAQAKGAGARLLGRAVTGVTWNGGGRLETDGGVLLCRSLILAVGARRRRLGVPGEERLAGRGVSWCATCDGSFFRGGTVAVVGGGNAAFGEAIALSQLCARVLLLVRSTARADRLLLTRAEQRQNLQQLHGVRVLEILGGERVTGLRILRDGREEQLAVDGVFEAIGTEPDTGLAASLLPRGEDGGIVTDRECRTAVPGIFAVGDCRSGAVRQLVTAAADGAVAGLLAAKSLLM